MAVAAPPSTSNHHDPILSVTVQEPSYPDVQMSEYSLTESDTSVHPEQVAASQETELQETQPVEHTELSSQEKRDKEAYEASIWGFLHPCSTAVSRIDFLKISDTYKFGRDARINSFVFMANKISNQHCTFIYDARTDEVTIHDHSSNGTFVSDSKIGKNKSRILRDGNEISLGPTGAAENEDYRWLYHHLGAGAKEPEDGTIWSRYDLGTEIGRGTFASVYRCMEKNTGKWYAVKIIQRAKFLNNPANERNFAREIDLLTRMRHKHIVELKEVFEEPETLYLVMEEIAGGELLMRITARNGLPEDDARYVAYQICDAMAYIHAQGVTHRDLKPENILLTNESPPVAKVADFGLAKLIEEGTVLKTMCGTPSYLAPEVILRGHDEGYTNLVDSWSMGALCFAMITNTSAFMEDGSTDIHNRIANRIIHWEGLIGRLSDAGIDFIRNLLRVEPEERMSLTEALSHEWIRDLTISCRSPPRSPRRLRPGEPAVPRHYSGFATNTMNSETMNSLGQSTIKVPNSSMIQERGDSPVHESTGLPEDYSQEFENLRLDSEGLNTPRTAVQPLPSYVYVPELDSQGEVKVPGFSPWSQTSKSRKSPSIDGDVGTSASGANGHSNDIESDTPAKASRKRKPNGSSADDDRDSSPLTEPPAEGESDDSSEESHDMYGLPTRQSKSTKRAAGDSPAVQAKPTTKSRGTGRAGTRKAGPLATRKTSGEKGKGKGKEVETVDIENADQPGTSSAKAPVRRSTRKSAK